MNEPLITLDNLAIGYDRQPVLSGISFSILRGSFTAILGANGSGKSTLLKTLLGLQPPIAGKIQIAAPAVFGYVPQAIEFDPLFLLNGFEVVLMGVYGRVGAGRFVPQNERAFVRECLRVTGAEEFARKKFSELSGGQKQRVLITRALATKPDVLVLDEPTAGVDAAATHALLEFISQIHAERKLTILLVTHDLPLVRKHAQQIIWLYRGKILTGTVAELFTPERMAEIFEMEVG
ncbi:MAG: metal ABC transporter ATP-binding protein [Verrucomicrobiota bacterium]|jgi:ABC-type Mn2+/Zn2+ transport system ATPase subunit